MTTNSRVLLGMTALLSVGLLAGCASNSGDVTKPADIKQAIHGSMPASQMAQMQKIEAASASQGAATEAKAKAAAASHPTGPPPPGSH